MKESEIFTEDEFKSTNKLTGLFYVLLRDYMSAGALERVVVDITNSEEGPHMSSFLGQYADKLANYFEEGRVNKWDKMFKQVVDEGLKDKQKMAELFEKAMEEDSEHRGVGPGRAIDIEMDESGKCKLKERHKQDISVAKELNKRLKELGVGVDNKEPVEECQQENYKCDGEQEECKDCGCDNDNGELDVMSLADQISKSAPTDTVRQIVEILKIELGKETQTQVEEVESEPAPVSPPSTGKLTGGVAMKGALENAFAKVSPYSKEEFKKIDKMISGVRKVGK